MTAHAKENPIAQKIREQRWLYNRIREIHRLLLPAGLRALHCLTLLAALQVDIYVLLFFVTHILSLLLLFSYFPSCTKESTPPPTLLQQLCQSPINDKFSGRHISDRPAWRSPKPGTEVLQRAVGLQGSAASCITPVVIDSTSLRCASRQDAPFLWSQIGFPNPDRRSVSVSVS